MRNEIKQQHFKNVETKKENELLTAITTKKKTTN